MRKTYYKILKSCFHSNLVQARAALKLTQSQMAERLAMDNRSYISLDHGENCCSAITLVLFLLYCCYDPLQFLEELRNAIENEE